MDMKGAGRILEGTLEEEGGVGWQYYGVGGPCGHVDWPHSSPRNSLNRASFRKAEL